MLCLWLSLQRAEYRELFEEVSMRLEDKVMYILSNMDSNAIYGLVLFVFSEIFTYIAHFHTFSVHTFEFVQAI
jgi:hypothetical protein